MFDRLRGHLPPESMFRKPLVFEISLVLFIKLLLITLLWHTAFKPLQPAIPPDIHLKMGLPAHPSKDVKS